MVKCAKAINLVHIFFTEMVRFYEQFVWFQSTDLNVIPVILQYFFH